MENVCLEGFTELMVKLSEAAFRPLFLKVHLQFTICGCQVNYIIHPSS